MAVTIDLPATFHDEATLVDSNFSFGLQDPQIPGSKIYTEKYVTKKRDFNYLPIGTMSEFHPEAQLYDETNFKDIGGGLMTFERKYAEVPPPVAVTQSAGVQIARLLGVAGFFRAHSLGGQLKKGRNFLGNEGQAINVFNPNNVNVFANVVTRFTDEDEETDFTPEIMTIVKEEVKTVTRTYTSVLYIRKSRSVTTPNFNKTLEFSRFLGRRTYRNLRYTREYYYDRIVTTRTFTNTTVIGSTFEAGTVFRREFVGRYLGNIMMIREYSLKDDIFVKFGNLVSGDAITTLNASSDTP